LRQRLEEHTRELKKDIFPTRRVAEHNEVLSEQATEIGRLLVLARDACTLVSSADPQLGRVVRFLDRAAAGVTVVKEAAIHETDAARVVNDSGWSVWQDVEGKSSLSSSAIRIRSRFILAERTNAKGDAATIAAANKGANRGGGGGQGGQGGQGKGKQRNNQNKTGKSDREGDKVKDRTCFDCGGKGPLAKFCTKKKN
jgi:hypothetical protein